MSCATTNPGTDDGSMPAKVLLRVRAIVTAGLAKLVDDVNQYAAAMYPATANGASETRPDRTTPKMTSSKPSVAMPSENHRSAPERTWSDTLTASSPNMRFAA